MSKRKRSFNAEPLVRRAARQLAEGDANAQRTLKGLEHLLALDIRIKSRAGADAQKQNRLAERERALDARAQELDARHVSLNKREFDLACEAQRLEELKESLDALYAIMYNKKPE